MEYQSSFRRCWKNYAKFRRKQGINKCCWKYKKYCIRESKTYFDLKECCDKIVDEYNQKFTASQWEEVLKDVLEKIYPEYKIKKTGGSKEEEHGTDVLVNVRGISENYNIAIQVKNYKGEDLLTKILI